MTKRMAVAGALVAASLMPMPQAASAQTILEQAAEHRFQLDFRVNQPHAVTFSA